MENVEVNVWEDREVKFDIYNVLVLFYLNIMLPSD